MAHKKGLGSSKNGRDSQSKRLGVKVFAGQDHQRRRHHRPPARHALPSRCRERRSGGDDTIFATGHGKVQFGRAARQAHRLGRAGRGRSSRLLTRVLRPRPIHVEADAAATARSRSGGRSTSRGAGPRRRRRWRRRCRPVADADLPRPDVAAVQPARRARPRRAGGRGVEQAAAPRAGARGARARRHAGVRPRTATLVCDLAHPGARVVIARGGREAPATSASRRPTRQAPRLAGSARTARRARSSCI